MEDFESLDKERNETNALIFYLLNERSKNKAINEPTEAEIEKILLNRIKSANLPKASQITNWQDVGTVVTGSIRQESKTEKGSNFKFKYIACDESDVIVYLSENKLNYRDYVAIQGQKSYVMLNLNYDAQIEAYKQNLASTESSTDRTAPIKPHPYLPVTSNEQGELKVLTNNMFLSTNQEITSIVVFRDEKTQEVDWSITLNRLSEYILTNYYSKKQTRACLLRIVGKYERGEYSLLEEIDDPNIIAQNLLKYESKIPTKIKFLGALKNSSRKPQETIDHSMGRISNILQKVYPSVNEETKRQEMLLQALVQFTVGPIKEEITKEIISRKNNGLYTNYGTLLEKVSKLEYSDPSNKPTTELFFDLNKKIGFFQVSVKGEEDEELDIIRNRKKLSVSDIPLPLCFGKDLGKDTKVYFQLNKESYNIPFEQIPSHLKKSIFESNGSFDVNENILETLAENKNSQNIQMSAHQKTLSQQYPISPYIGNLVKNKLENSLPEIDQRKLEEEAAAINFTDERKTRQSVKEKSSEINVIKNDYNDYSVRGKERRESTNSKQDRGRNRERRTRNSSFDRKNTDKYSSRNNSFERKNRDVYSSKISNDKDRNNRRNSPYYNRNRSATQSRSPSNNRRFSSERNDYNKNRSTYRNRSFSRGRNGYNSRQSSKPERGRERSESRSYKQSYNNRQGIENRDNRYRSPSATPDERNFRNRGDRYRSSSRNRRERNYRQRSSSRNYENRQREVSSEQRDLIDLYSRYRNFNPGYNCRLTYNPEKNGKECLKCFTKKGSKYEHYEFNCPDYVKYSERNCNICKKGFHLESQCLKAYPPNFNNILTAVGETVSENIKTHLKELLENEPKN